MTATTITKSPVAVSTIVSESRIDADSHFNGLYETRQDLCIEGVAEGEIQCDGTLTVAEGAQVKAKVTANTVTIAGDLEGEVVCRGVFQILPTGQVEASVSARRLIVQEGGVYNGEFHMITEAVSSPAAPAATSAAASTSRTSDRTPRPENWSEPITSLSDGSPVLNSDEWWEKMTGKRPGMDDSEDGPA